MKFLLLSITLSSLTLAGCNYNDLKNSGAGRNGAAGITSPDASIDFQTVKAAVFEPACIKCHGDKVAKDGVRVDEYAFAVQHLADIRGEVEAGDMPPPPPRGAILSPEQKAMLIAWIDSGAPEKTVLTPKPPSETRPPDDVEPPVVAEPAPLPVPPPAPAPVPGTGPSPDVPDFAMVSQTVFQPHCIKCHSNTVAKGHLNLEDYANAASHAEEIVESLQTDEMPRKASPLTEDLKAIVYAWVLGGAPETVP